MVTLIIIQVATRLARLAKEVGETWRERRPDASARPGNGLRHFRPHEVEDGGSGSSLRIPCASDRLPAPFWTSRHPAGRIPLSLHPGLSPQSDNRGLQETTTPWSSPRTDR